MIFARISAFILAWCCAFPAGAADHPPLERGTAITDPAALRELDGGRFGLGRILPSGHANDGPLTSAQLFDLPSMAPVKKALDAEFERYVANHKTELPGESIGAGPGHAFELFDAGQLASPGTRFVLSGIVNRMDRAYVAPETCGEIRLIYRLARTDAREAREAAVSPRLPMTLNVVLKAKGDRVDAANGAGIGCAEIAKRWLAVANEKATGAGLVEKLIASGGALERVGPETIERIETNLQIAHAPKSPTREFRTDYLMKVFDYDTASKTFIEAKLENQIDRDRLLTDGALAQDFKSWMLDPVHFSELDRGMILIPDRFLATRAVAPTPVGFAPSKSQPAFGLVAYDDGAGSALFTNDDVVAALARVTARGIKLQNIRSVAGFERRLNDIGCAGCHQTRGIGGFHFPGVDWMATKPSNATVVPASPQFFGDQVRRRDILAAFAGGKTPDFSRGFANRPQTRGSSELDGSEYKDGWGAHCYEQHANASENDKSFAGWTCAKGLTCEAASAGTRMGMCFVKTR